MNANKIGLQKISDFFELGKIRKSRGFSKGLVSGSLKLETDRGKYVIKFAERYNDRKKKRLLLQFKILDYLSKRKFPYDLPSPIRGRSGAFLMIFGSRVVWAYRYLDGKTKRKLTGKEFRELARLVATYHKYVEKFRVGKINLTRDSNWIVHEIDKTSKKRPKNKTDRLYLRNCELIKAIIKKSNIYCRERMIYTHSDFNPSNILYKNGKITGILDFDNVAEGPRAKDVAGAVRGAGYPDPWSKTKEKQFLGEYEKILPLTKKEKDTILPLLIRELAINFWWLYSRLDKNSNAKYALMIKTLNQLNNVVKKSKAYSGQN
ncbi:MAG: phosphotransferase [Nanoarchaeota archaeon]|nr:phosphotransferase [Nanoarchaeota archaeon]